MDALLELVERQRQEREELTALDVEFADAGDHLRDVQVYEHARALRTRMQLRATRIEHELDAATIPAEQLVALLGV
jgi:predicted XRE-type DNA-binding protein